MFANILKNKTVLYGGLGLLAVGGAYYIFSGSGASGGSNQDTTFASYPDVSYAQAPIAAGALGGGGSAAGDSASAALAALSDAVSKLNPSDTVTLASVNAGQTVALANDSVTVFNSLMKTFNAHLGLGRISAVVPNVGTVSVYKGKPVVTHTVTKTITKPLTSYSLKQLQTALANKKKVAA